MASLVSNVLHFLIHTVSDSKASGLQCKFYDCVVFIKLKDICSYHMSNNLYSSASQTQARLILNFAILTHSLRLGDIKHQIWIQSSILLGLFQLVSGWGILVHNTTFFTSYLTYSNHHFSWYCVGRCSVVHSQ